MARHRFRTPPPADPIAAARDSSLALRLNIGFFLRQLGIFLVMDLILLTLAFVYLARLFNGGESYTVTVALTDVIRVARWAGGILLACQGLFLVCSLFGSGRSIRKVLRPIQDLAAAAARLNAMTHMSKREIESLAGELGKIDAAHLDSRIDLPPTRRSCAPWPRLSTR